ncbi:MAG: phosphatidylserine decarboxylase [Actinobacteria bacterium]|nr:phosphatidylserine decarboxylase [Actinomycetota bacterium]
MIRIILPSIAILLILISGIVYYLRYIYFFRDPERISPANPDYLYSPCDGLVVYVKKVVRGEIVSEKLGKKIRIEEISGSKNGERINIDEGWLVGIYMSPLDVHFNYAPQHSKVKKVFYKSAKVNYPMVDLWEYMKMTYLKRAVDNFSKKFHLENERNTIVLDVSGQDVVLIEIADKFVNKIDCFVKPGDYLKAGQKISFIRRGSQVDVLVSSTSFEPVVSKGERVKGAISPIFKKKF